MTTTQSPETAKVFPSHRALVEAITVLKDAGEIDGYSIHATDNGVYAGVRKADAWAFLADEG